MKGFILTHDNHQIAGGIEKGTTGVTFSINDQTCQISFNSLDNDGMQAYGWYSSEVPLGNQVSVQFVEITDSQAPLAIIDYNDTDMSARLELETYYKLKEELENEGSL